MDARLNLCRRRPRTDTNLTVTNPFLSGFMARSAIKQKYQRNGLGFSRASLWHWFISFLLNKPCAMNSIISREDMARILFYRVEKSFANIMNDKEIRDLIQNRPKNTTANTIFQAHLFRCHDALLFSLFVSCRKNITVVRMLPFVIFDPFPPFANFFLTITSSL
jgi:hypothetical protein